jgi:Uma2 family endonuclease
MSEPYEEILEGETIRRPSPGPRHEMLVQRLHDRIRASVAGLTSTQLLAARSPIQISRTTNLRPDLALVAALTGKLWLAAEVIQSGDHHTDTVVKKELYEGLKVPRLWMVDPRYNNVEVYHATEHGLMLKGILAGKEILTEKLLPKFQFIIAELFDALPPG